MNKIDKLVTVIENQKNEIEELKVVLKKNESIKDKQREIYNYYGFDIQLDKLEEECLELALGIKHRDKPGNDNFRNIVEEIADVLNLIEQIIDNNKCLKRGVDNWKEYKVNRELDRISRR